MALASLAILARTGPPKRLTRCLCNDSLSSWSTLALMSSRATTYMSAFSCASFLARRTKIANYLPFPFFFISFSSFPLFPALSYKSLPSLFPSLFPFLLYLPVFFPLSIFPFFFAQLFLLSSFHFPLSSFILFPLFFSCFAPTPNPLVSFSCP